MVTSKKKIRQEYLVFGKPNFGVAESEAVRNVLESGWVGMGPETKSFEQELEKYIDAGSVIAVNSCTSALYLALKVSGVQEGDEVICPSLTWCSTANAVIYLGAKPVFCDVDESTMSLTPATVKAKLSDKTKAVLVVHFGGLACDVEEIRKVIPEHVSIVEDAAHALGATYPDGTKVGSKGNLTCFSFYANKNLSVGDGGAIATCDPELGDRIRSLSHLGLNNNAWKRFSSPTANIKVEPQEIGYKMNLTDIQSSIGRVQLKRQAEFNRTRQQIAEAYHRQLSNSIPGLKYQVGLQSKGHAKHLFPIVLPVTELDITRDEFVVGLRERNIGASVHYPLLHLMDCYRFENSQLPGTEFLGERILTLPISSCMTTDDVTYVTEHLTELFFSHVQKPKKVLNQNEYN